MDFWRGRSWAKIQKFVIRAAVMFLLYILDSSFKQLKTFEAFQKKICCFCCPKKRRAKENLKSKKGWRGTIAGPLPSKLPVMPILDFYHQLRYQLRMEHVNESATSHASPRGLSAHTFMRSKLTDIRFFSPIM